MKDKRVQNFMWTLGYSGSFVVSCEGLSGGLVLFWLKPFSVELKGFNAHASMWSFQEILEINGEQPLCMGSLEEINDTNFGNFSDVFGPSGMARGCVVVISTRHLHMMSTMALVTYRTHKCNCFENVSRIVSLLILGLLDLNILGRTDNNKWILM
jgi:hypothetical protein